MAKSIMSKHEVIQDSFDTTYYLFGDNKNKPRLETLKGDQSRHIFIFLDGTWNEDRNKSGITTPTNVLRMYQEMNISPPSTDDEGPIVIAHYYRGVGSRQDNNAANRMWFGFSGKDEERIRNAAFADLYRDIRSEKDSVYIIGFSRGAASARLLATDICTRGLPPKLKVYTSYFPNLLTRQIEARTNKIKRFDCEHNIPFRVAFLGCWDTVDAFVLPSRFPKNTLVSKIMDSTLRTLTKAALPRFSGSRRFRPEERNIPTKVNRAVHCVAIDETRNAFLPTLMPSAPNVEEVWFPGVHSDIGGGYDDSLLSEGPYQFMKTRLINSIDLPIGALFRSSAESTKSSEDYCFHFHGLNTGVSRPKGIFGFGTNIRKIHVLNSNQNELPKIHSSFLRITNGDSVFAANIKNKRTWRVTYDPYNVEELGGEFHFIGEQQESQDWAKLD